MAVNGLAVFPQLSAQQREEGMTDSNDLGRAQPEVVSRQLRVLGTLHTKEPVRLDARFLDGRLLQ